MSDSQSADYDAALNAMSVMPPEARAAIAGVIVARAAAETARAAVQVAEERLARLEKASAETARADGSVQAFLAMYPDYLTWARALDRSWHRLGAVAMLRDAMHYHNFSGFSIPTAIKAFEVR
jgi:hypothetical protein